MEFAILARPQWRSPLESASPSPQDPRIVCAPVQELVLLNADPAILQSHLLLEHPWIVFTSPASVVAFHALLQRSALDISAYALRYVAVGNGTRDHLLRVFPHLSQADVLVSADPERADANSTLAALDVLAAQEGMQWAEQQFLVIEGHDNRPTVREGLIARGAKAASSPIYERIDVDWPQPVWQRLSQARPGAVGIVITSTTVIDRVLQAMKARRLDPSRFRWCTQHLSIANKLMHAGLGPVGHVRLDAQHLTGDLFTHGNNW